MSWVACVAGIARVPWVSRVSGIAGVPGVSPHMGFHISIFGRTGIAGMSGIACVSWVACVARIACVSWIAEGMTLDVLVLAFSEPFAILAHPASFSWLLPYAY